jgi:hypothetical protein
MKDLLSLCSYLKYEIKHLEPMLTTQFTIGDCDGPFNNGIFSNVKDDIRGCKSFGKKQIIHFIEYICLLEQCDYPLYKIGSIHILSSDINDKIHFVQINNTNFFQENNGIIENSANYDKLYINYKPELFDDKWSKISSGEKIGWYLPSTYTNHTKKIMTNHNSKFSIDIVNKKISSKRSNLILTTILNGLTFSNCTIYIIMYWINKNPNFTQNLIKHPFDNSLDIIISSLFYGTIGIWISNIGSYYFPKIIINGILCWINYNLFKLISARKKLISP